MSKRELGFASKSMYERFQFFPNCIDEFEFKLKFSKAFIVTIYYKQVWTQNKLTYKMKNIPIIMDFTE